MKKTFKLLSLLLLSAWSLQGCTTASSMRVEVQVYKGPLSKEQTIQEGELAGVLNAFANSVSRKVSDARAVLASGLLSEAHKKSLELKTARAEFFCYRALELALDIDQHVRGTVSNTTFEEISAFATEMKMEAMDMTYSLNIEAPDNLKFRMLAVGYINLLAETSNQLSSRSDALQKQKHTPKGKLAQSVYLRDSAPTSMLNALAWNEAMNINRGEGRGWFDPSGTSPFDIMSDSDSRTDRVRALEHHFTDHYWSTINTVVASGEGDTGMALVKDDIGNWNLKNFESDPTNMIKAYKDVGLAALSTAADLVKSAQTGNLSSAQKFLNVADRFNFGSGNQSGATFDTAAEKLRIATATSLKSLAEEMKAMPDALRKQSNDKVNEASNSSSKTPAGCPNTSTEAEKIAAQARVDAYKILGELPAQGATDNAKLAYDTATAAKSSADNATGSNICQEAENAQTGIKKAQLYLAAYKLDQQLVKLPATGQEKAKAILDEYERNLTDLVRVSLATATQPKDETAKATTPTTLPALLQGQ